MKNLINIRDVIIYVNIHALSGLSHMFLCMADKVFLFFLDPKSLSLHMMECLAGDSFQLLSFYEILLLIDCYQVRRRSLLEFEVEHSG